jgi:hypothetical protein
VAAWDEQVSAPFVFKGVDHSMKSILLFVLLVVLILIPGQIVQAQEVTGETPEPYAGTVLCLPASRYNRPVVGECLLAGPAAWMERALAAGMKFPYRPFAYEVLDSSLWALDYRYMRVRDDVRRRVPVYASLDDVANGRDSGIINYLETNFTFITYLDIVDSRYVLTSAGTWVDRGDVSPVGIPMTFRGITLPYTPPTDFGWIFLETYPREQPGFNHPEFVNELYFPNQVVQVYEAVEVNGWEWFRIGEKRWVEGRMVNRVMVNTTPPQGVENGRWIEVNLGEQTLSVYDNRRLVFATVIATGYEPMYTRPGLFPIYKKLDYGPMSGSFTVDRSDYYYLDHVPWTLYYDKARALHGAYWRTKLGHPQSHGCVNLSIGDARWVYDWADEGDWVYVWDPTGQTPTDPNFYGDGGA